MPATLGASTTFNASTFDTSGVKALMTAIAVPNSSIVYDVSSTIIYKITVGTGTYADIYVRFSPQFGTNFGGATTGMAVTVGTNQTNGTLSGAGATQFVFTNTSAPGFYPHLQPATFRTIATTDNTVWGAILLNGSPYAGFLLFIQRSSTHRKRANP